MFSSAENLRILSVKLVKYTQHCTHLDNLRPVAFLFLYFSPSFLPFAFKVGHLQEEEKWGRQLFGERGVTGGHFLLHPNDRRQRLQLGHLRRDGVSAGTETDTVRPRPICCLGPATVNEVTSSPQPNLVDDWRPLRAREHRHYILRGVWIFGMSAKDWFFVYVMFMFFIFCFVILHKSAARSLNWIAVRLLLKLL